MRLFLDANILFSAAYSVDGGARELVRLSEAGHCKLMASEHAISEARRNLYLKSPVHVPELVRIIEAVECVPEPGSSLVAWAASFGLPVNDAPILAAAAATGADFLVTGDRKHFSHLFGATIGRVRVITLVEALEMVVES